MSIIYFPFVLMIEVEGVISHHSSFFSLSLDFVRETDSIQPLQQLLQVCLCGIVDPVCLAASVTIFTSLFLIFNVSPSWMLIINEISRVVSVRRWIKWGERVSFLGPSMAQKERKRDAFFFNYFSTLTAMAVNKA
jgi:hypothetical protein